MLDTGAEIHSLTYLFCSTCNYRVLVEYRICVQDGPKTRLCLKACNSCHIINYINFFKCSIVSLNLCKEFLNVAVLKKSVFLDISCGTV